MTEEAQAALQSMGIPRLAHTSQGLTSDLVSSAEAVLCMTFEQREEVRTMFPQAAAKIHCLDLDNDIPDPSGAGEQVFRDVASRLSELIAIRLTESGFAEEA